MSWLSADAEFNPDTLNNSVIGVQAELGDHDSGLHRHRMGQLLFTREGCVKLTLDEGRMLSLLPPGKVASVLCRTRLREMLASHRRLTDVAGELGFSSDSAFIYFYRSIIAGRTGRFPGGKYAQWYAHLRRSQRPVR